MQITRTTLKGKWPIHIEIGPTEIFYEEPTCRIVIRTELKKLIEGRRHYLFIKLTRPEILKILREFEKE